MQNLYYALPLSVFYFLSKNAWHGIYDYEQIAKDCGLQLESTQSYKLCGLFPAYQKWTLKKIRSSGAKLLTSFQLSRAKVADKAYILAKNSACIIIRSNLWVAAAISSMTAAQQLCLGAID